MILRGHHLLDIVAEIGKLASLAAGQECGSVVAEPASSGLSSGIGSSRALVPFAPNLDYGHDLHGVAARIQANLDQPLELVIAADDICIPCRHLGPDRLCRDVLAQVEDRPSKQSYNDRLDHALMSLLSAGLPRPLTVRGYLRVAQARLPEVASLCTHPGEEPADKRENLVAGLVYLLEHTASEKA